MILENALFMVNLIQCLHWFTAIEQFFKINGFINFESNLFTRAQGPNFSEVITLAHPAVTDCDSVSM